MTWLWLWLIPVVVTLALWLWDVRRGDAQEFLTPEQVWERAQRLKDEEADR